MKPGSPEWQRVVTASKVAAILGLSPWDSPRTMWHLMRGDLPRDDDRNATAKARGHYLEAGVVQWWIDQHDDVASLTEQHSLTLGDWAAATPDLTGVDEFGNRFVMDAKTAATADDWGTPGTDEVPAYYLAQSMWQLACYPSAQIAYVAVLFGRPNLEFAEYIIQRDDALIEAIVYKCREFYDSLTDDEAGPALSGMACEYEVLRRVHADIERGEIAAIPAELAAEYAAAYHAEKALKGIKARVLDAMGQAQYGTDPSGQKVARRQPSRDGVALYCTAPNPTPTELENIA